MRKVDNKELKAIIKDYASCENILEPLVIFLGKYQKGVCLRIIKEIFGESNFWKIGASYDSPNVDIPFCLFDAYYGNADNELLLHCFEIANNIHRPVFCFISSNYEEGVPKEVYNKSYRLIEEKL